MARPRHRLSALALANMTEGHRLAIEQLRAIQENAREAFEVVRVANQPNSAGWLHIEIGLDCLGKAYSEGGVWLKRREWFAIGVPADSPYQLPSTWTRHARFPGLPHVQWKRHLCLYQAPVTEWNGYPECRGLTGTEKKRDRVVSFIS